MLYIIVVLACTIGFAIYSYQDGYNGWSDVAFGGLIGTIIGFFLCLIIILPIHCVIDDYAEKTTDKIATHEISAFADNFEFEGRVNGNIFLTSGYVNEKLKYGYMYAVEGKGYGYDIVSAENTYINRTSNSHYIEIYNVHYVNSIIEWLFPCMDSDEYIVYLPESAEITTEYVIDLK